MSLQDKSPDAFRTISEVAEDLDLPQHVLRFWETRFSQIRPLKRGGGRRYYRPDDVELLRGIRHLLYGEGYTIKGVQRILKEQGSRFVMQVWREDALPVPVMQHVSAEQNSADKHDLEPQTDPLPDMPRDVLPDSVESAKENVAAKPGSSLRFMDRFRQDKERPEPEKGSGSLSANDLRRLQSTLFELLECKRILDQVR